MPKPDDHLDFESAHEYSGDLPEQSSEISSDEPSEPHLKVTMLTRMKVARNCFRKKEQKLHQ